jgi:predicted esterase
MQQMPKLSSLPKEFTQLIKPKVVPPQSLHKESLIFLHGLGDQGYGWAESFAPFQRPGMKMIFPHAPSQPVSLNGGMRMPSWFDIYSLEKVDGKCDTEGLQKAQQYGNLLLSCR